MTELLLSPVTQQAVDNFLARPVHAVLLSGQAGLGKNLLAHELLTSLLLLNGHKLEDFPYFQLVEPDKGTITIEQIRQLNGFFARKVPGQNRFKRAVLINSAELLSLPASNALLKILEEPPADTVIALTTSRIEAILPTIRSRSQLVSVVTPEKTDITRYFSKQGFTEAEIGRAWLIARGNIARLQSILTDPSKSSDSLDLVKQVLSSDSFERLVIVNQLIKQKELAFEFVELLGRVADASLQAAATGNKPTLARWHKVLRASDVAGRSLAKNGSPKLVLTELMLSL
ncbi:MAG: hypothetical protein ABI220_02945 [Candidatus Saccharimonadales bacterium]